MHYFVLLLCITTLVLCIISIIIMYYYVLILCVTTLVLCTIMYYYIIMY